MCPPDEHATDNLALKPAQSSSRRGRGRPRGHNPRGSERTLWSAVIAFNACVCDVASGTLQRGPSLNLRTYRTFGTRDHKPVTRRTRSSVGRQERILRRGLHDARARRKRNLEKNATQRTTLHITRVAQYPSRENTSTLGGQSLCYTCTKHGNDIPHRLACDKDTFLQRRRVLEPSTAANSHTRTVPA